MGPLEAQKPWNTRDIVGMSRFLNAVWRNLIGEEEEASASPSPGTPFSPSPGTPLSPSPGTPGEGRGEGSLSSAKPSKASRITADPIPDALDRQLHRTIKKVGEDIEGLRFNTAIAELIKLNNEIGRLPTVPRALAETLALLLAPFAPHLAEELWQRLGHDQSLARQPWPKLDQAKLAESTMELPVQVNGKLRDRIVVPADSTEEFILQAAETSEKLRPWLAGKTLRKRLYVEKKLVNFVVS